MISWERPIQALIILHLYLYEEIVRYLATKKSQRRELYCERRLIRRTLSGPGTSVWPCWLMFNFNYLRVELILNRKSKLLINLNSWNVLAAGLGLLINGGHISVRISILHILPSFWEPWEHRIVRRDDNNLVVWALRCSEEWRVSQHNASQSSHDQT